ncbi:hypothetical protein GCM10020000_01000 [Streptomyces olivoverticillatus]
MRAEAWLFAGVAGFFLVTDLAYAWFSGQEPAEHRSADGLLRDVVADVLLLRHELPPPRPAPGGPARRRRGGARRAARLLPPHSAYPAMTALGVALLALGVVYGLWLFIIAFGILAGGVLGMTFQFVARGE